MNKSTVESLRWGLEGGVGFREVGVAAAGGRAERTLPNAKNFAVLLLNIHIVARKL